MARKPHPIRSPGPWTVKTTDTVYTITSADGVRVASTSWHGSIRNPYPLRPEAWRNAHLLAAAPSLLDALRTVREFVEAEVENRGAAGGDMSDYQDEARQALDAIDAALALASPQSPVEETR